MHAIFVLKPFKNGSCPALYLAQGYTLYYRTIEMCCKKIKNSQEVQNLTLIVTVPKHFMNAQLFVTEKDIFDVLKNQRYHNITMCE